MIQIIDTGPLVAFLNKNDSYHQWTLDVLGKIKPPLYTSEAVISEAHFLLQRSKKGLHGLYELLDRQLVVLRFDLSENIKEISSLVEKYQQIPMSLADATIVRMTELVQASVVITIDSDFSIYRKNKSKIIDTIMPN